MARLLVFNCYGLQKLDVHDMYTTDVGKTGQSLEFQIPMPVLILISHPLSSWEDRAISEVWWIANGAFVGLCFRLLKLGMHYVYATDGGKLCEVWNFRFRYLYSDLPSYHPPMF